MWKSSLDDLVLHLSLIEALKCEKLSVYLLRVVADERVVMRSRILTKSYRPTQPAQTVHRRRNLAQSQVSLR